MSNAIEVSPGTTTFVVAIPGEGIRLKQQMLAAAAAITQVTNAKEQEQATIAAGKLKGLAQAVEALRQELKKPHLEVGRAIDAKAAEYVGDITVRVRELEGKIGAFQRAEREKAAEAERASAAERQRVATEVEQARQRAAAAQSEEERLAAQFDLMESEDAASTANATVVAPEPPAAKGVAIREDKVEFEVTDIEAFYAWDLARRQAAGDRHIPTFVKLEVRKQDFNSYINIVGIKALGDIPGMKFTQKTNAAVRGIAPSIALQ